MHQIYFTVADRLDFCPIKDTNNDYPNVFSTLRIDKEQEIQ